MYPIDPIEILKFSVTEPLSKWQDSDASNSPSVLVGEDNPELDLGWSKGTTNHKQNNYIWPEHLLEEIWQVRISDFAFAFTFYHKIEKNKIIRKHYVLLDPWIP